MSEDERERRRLCKDIRLLEKAIKIIANINEPPFPRIEHYKDFLKKTNNEYMILDDGDVGLDAMALLEMMKNDLIEQANNTDLRWAQWYGQPLMK